MAGTGESLVIQENTEHEQPVQTLRVQTTARPPPKKLRALLCLCVLLVASVLAFIIYLIYAKHTGDGGF